MVYVLSFIQLMVILYLIRLTYGLKADSKVRLKNWQDITKAFKDQTTRIEKLERRK
jgi:hypothetical protein